MPLDPSFVGRAYPPTEPYRVDRDHIRGFADAVGDANPVYHDPAAARALGYPDVIAPPTYPVVLTFPAGRQIVGDPELGLDYTKVVHGEQSFSYSRPVRAGDVLQVVASVDSIRSAAGNDLITTRNEITTIEGEHVVTALTTLVSRGTSGA